MKRNIQAFKSATFIVFTILLVVSLFVTLGSHAFSELFMQIPVLRETVMYHTAIMALSIVVAIGFGFALSQVLSTQLEIATKDAHTMSEVVMKFLAAEERLVLQHLKSHDGKCTQSDIARLNNMGRVKAMRTVQKLAQRGIIQVTPFGKQRNITLAVSVDHQPKRE